MWLLVDDQRSLGCEVIARTPLAAVKLLDYMADLFECICLDFDMEDTETGLDVLRYAIAAKKLPPRVQLITQNPVGRKAMQDALADARYISSDGGTNWIPA